MRKMISLSLLIVVIATLLSGCGGNGAAAATTAVCTGLTALETTIASVSTLSAETTVSDVQAITARLDVIMTPVRKAATAVKNPSLDQLVAAYDEVNKTISGLPADKTLGDAAANLSASISKVSSAIAPLKTSLKCAN